MAITTKYLEELGIDKETAARIFAERGKEVSEANTERATLEEKLAQVTETLEALTKEAEALKLANADGAEWKSKYDELQEAVTKREREAEEARLQKEKAADIEARFNAVVGEKKFGHEAIRESYLRKFGEALDSDEYKGKGDKDIFHALSKDDGAAFKGPEIIKLAGGSPNGSSVNLNEAKARSVMGLPANN